MFNYISEEVLVLGLRKYKVNEEEEILYVTILDNKNSFNRDKVLRYKYLKNDYHYNIEIGKRYKFKGEFTWGSKYNKELRTYEKYCYVTILDVEEVE